METIPRIIPNKNFLYLKLLVIARLAYLSVLIGRAWQICIGDFPIRTLLWDEKLLRNFIENNIKISWQSYLQFSEEAIHYILAFLSIFFIIGALYTITSRDNSKTIYALTTCLIFCALLFWKEKSYQWAELGEYGLQCITPLVYYYFSKNQTLTVIFFYILILAAALTFAAHGIYALGILPTPALFLDMTLYLLPFNQEEATWFLLGIGCLDIFAALGITLTYLRNVALLWMIFWGGITTLARLSLIQAAPNLIIGIYENIHEVLVRISHFLLPLFIWLYANKYKNLDEK
ncbi:MAG: hypothetical protein RML72_09070 [Bacteroidia bacterium]|nr:hypothetical protein [Bacteroidia bacterium]MDW8159007.1 hypothetical protein [Bacteroidia bacterium]